MPNPPAVFLRFCFFFGALTSDHSNTYKNQVVGDEIILMNSEDHLREAEDYFHNRIPLTRAMGLRVTESNIDRFAVEAPVSLNSNHLGTAFGGSINVVTMAAYGFLWVRLREEAVDVVIRDSSIRFLHPVTEIIHAICTSPDPKEWQSFEAILHAKGKARIALHVRLEERGRDVAKLKGTFVAIRRSVH